MVIFSEHHMDLGFNFAEKTFAIEYYNAIAHTSRELQRRQLGSSLDSPEVCIMFRYSCLKFGMVGRYLSRWLPFIAPYLRWATRRSEVGSRAVGVWSAQCLQRRNFALKRQAVVVRLTFAITLQFLQYSNTVGRSRSS